MVFTKVGYNFKLKIFKNAMTVKKPNNVFLGFFSFNLKNVPKTKIRISLYYGHLTK